MTFEQFVNLCKKWFIDLVLASKDVIDWLITPVDPSNIPVIGILLPKVWLEYTPLSLMLGAGVCLYLTWTLVKWLIP